MTEFVEAREHAMLSYPTTPGRSVEEFWRTQ
jgi:hypothetical protein